MPVFKCLTWNLSSGSYGTNYSEIYTVTQYVFVLSDVKSYEYIKQSRWILFIAHFLMCKSIDLKIYYEQLTAGKNNSQLKLYVLKTVPACKTSVKLHAESCDSGKIFFNNETEDEMPEKNQLLLTHALKW